MIELSKPELRSLTNIVNTISCEFIDTRTTSKDYVRLTAADENLDKTLNQGFVLSTCLRYEIYRFNEKQINNANSLFRASGALCLRRLLSLMIGLQSEIVGEKEILLQITNSITKAHDNGYLTDEIYSDLENLRSVAVRMREQYYLDNAENYSTIAADMFVDHLIARPDSTIAIVGGGYMADKFFEALLRSNGTKIKKILWLNRSTTKIESAILEISHLLDFDVEVLSLSEGSIALKESNAIFCAISDSPSLYSRSMVSKGVFVVDVSYPQVFEDHKNMQLINIGNTNFSKLVKKPVPYANIVLANKALDNQVRSLTI